ncbi:MAG: SLATT domain-containing protein [Pseudomonadota bacterium]
MDARAQEIVRECRRQSESCLYTSTALFSWYKEVRVWRVAFIVLPIVAGSIASAKILLKNPDYDWLTAVAALLAGLFPAIFKALDLDVSLKNIADSAGRFKVLQDRFRQAALIGASKTTDELDEDFKSLMDRMDDARLAAPTIPERHFKRAQKKIQKGDYSFDSAPDDGA